MEVDGLRGKTVSFSHVVSMPWLIPLLRCLSFCFLEGTGYGGSENEGGDGTKQTTNCQKPDNEFENEDPTTRHTQHPFAFVSGCWWSLTFDLLK